MVLRLKTRESRSSPGLQKSELRRRTKSSSSPLLMFIQNRSSSRSGGFFVLRSLLFARRDQSGPTIAIDVARPIGQDRVSEITSL
jgi:hypothetical protein